MTPQELKASILQLAIQGKLVEQRPEEGTGEELYQQIQAEKQLLTKAGKIKKEKPLPEIVEDEIPFDIPENWKWYRLGELFNIVNGFTPLKSNPEFWEDGDIPWFTIEDVHRQGRFISSTEKFITRKALSKNTERIVPADTVLLCCTASVGEYAYTKIPLTTNQQFNAFVLKEHYKNAVYPLYVFEYAKTLKGSLIDQAGKTTFNFVSVWKLSNMLIPLPPFAEQKRIVAKIEELLPYIDRYEQAWSKLEKFNKRFPVDMQKSILQTAIQGKLVPQLPEEGTGEELFQQIQAEKQALIKAGKIKKEKPLPEITEDEIPFDIPESWKWVRVAQIVTLNPKNDLDDDLEVAFIPMPCVQDGFRNQHTFEIKKWKEIKKGFTHFADGDIGVAKITPCFQNRKSVIFKNLISGYGAGTTELTVVRTINETVLPEYLLWFFKSEYFIANGVKSFTGTAGQQRIHKDYLATCLIPLPPLAEQKRIVAKLEEILPLCERLK